MTPIKLPQFPASAIALSLTCAALGCILFAGFIYLSVATIKLPALLMQPEPTVSIDPSTITAKAALLYDSKTKRVLFAKNATASLPLASLTKLMTAQTVLSTRPANTLITINSTDLKPEGDWGLSPGDVLSIGNLIKYALVASSNDAIAAAANSLGSAYLDDMNKTAGQLGLTHTYFLNSTGLDLSTDTSGAYGSAYDVALLTSAFLKQYPQYLEPTTKASITLHDGDKMLSAAATALPIQDIPGFLGAKTGYTDLAGGNLVAAFDLDIAHPLVAVVLGSTQDGRFSDVRAMIEAARAVQSQ